MPSNIFCHTSLCNLCRGPLGTQTSSIRVQHTGDSSGTAISLVDLWHAFMVQFLAEPTLMLLPNQGTCFNYSSQKITETTSFSG